MPQGLFAGISEGWENCFNATFCMYLNLRDITELNDKVIISNGDENDINALNNSARYDADFTPLYPYCKFLYNTGTYHPLF
jgi:hypothetical protein